MKPRFMPPVSSDGIWYGSPDEPNSLRKALDDQRQSEREQQSVQMIELVQPRQHRALDQHADRADDDGREEQRPPVPYPGFVQQEPRAERAHHVLRTVREIDDVQQPEDHRETQRQHRVERAVDEPDQQLAEECLQSDPRDAYSKR